MNLRTARDLGLKPGQKITVHGVAGTLPGYRQQGVTAKVGEVELPHEYLAIDLEKLSRTCGRRVDGLVGADFFRGHVVQIDYDAHRIRLLKPEAAAMSGKALPLQLRPSGMCLPIRVNGHQDQWVRLDTGCAMALEWVTSDVTPGIVAHQMAIGLAAISIPQAETSVGIGDQEFENVPTGLHKTPIFPGEAGLLGNGLLSRFSSITIDVSAARVTLEKRHPIQ
jgi:hypothetical protein